MFSITQFTSRSVAQFPINLWRKSLMAKTAPVLLASAIAFSGCGAQSGAPYSGAPYSGGDSASAANTYSTGGSAIVNDESYDAVFFEDYGVNPFVDTEDDHLSTFAMDVDTASYSVARRFIQDGNMPDSASVRTEEFINYFDHDYEPPADGTFAIHLEAAPSPFGGERHKLMRVGLQGKVIDDSERLDASLVFVIDVSGSMSRENRIGLVKRSLGLLVEELRPTDEVGIIVYGGGAGVVLNATKASAKDEIMAAINRLEVGGSTNLEEGLMQGYRMAEKMLQQAQGERVARLILCSDGVANVGNTGSNSILNRVQSYVDQGITLSTVGFGMGNYNDVLMEQLANDGDGNYGYVDSLDEANRFFVENLTGMLQVIAKDAKVQVDFNADVVQSYRLLGYENRDVADDDFRNDNVDAGEVGAGHNVTALYELKLHKAVEEAMANTPDLAVGTVHIRYQDMETDEVVEESGLLTLGGINANFESASTGFQLTAAVAEYAEILKESYWAQDGNLTDVRMLAEQVGQQLGEDEDVAEFIELVTQAEGIAGKVAQSE